MPFTVKDFHDLVRVLEQHPEWRAELRKLLLPEELLSLPQLIHELGQRIRDLSQEVTRLVEAQRRTEDQISELALTVRQLVVDVGDLKGEALERRYRDRAFAYFAPILRRIKVVPGQELMEKLEQALEKSVLSPTEVEEVAQADLVVRGIHRELGEEVYLIVEVSWGIGRTDVERASMRAQALLRTGIRALPAVAGKAIAPEAQNEAKERGVWQIIDGKAFPP